MEKNVLIIDDSATIRRLVDSELTAAGYCLLMAPDAEIGIDRARSEKPDLILLDHQLPGTTGYQVCCELARHEETRSIPVVISSTLRNKAYAEYVDLPNVVDMLPKPYTPEMLKTTVGNAIETASLIVQSQSDGSAVPEVISAVADGDLAGNLKAFSLREILDFLNNAAKTGLLELESPAGRFQVYVGKGRIQAVSASGVPTQAVTDSLPASLVDLAPMVKFTLSGRNCSETDGLLELLNNKVIDPRLLKQLLRHQAAMLLGHCWEVELQSFRFVADCKPPTLFDRLALDISLAALLVEHAGVRGGEPLDPATVFVRDNLRSQNLDRAGLDGAHMKVLNLLNAATPVEKLLQQTGLEPAHLHAVLKGFLRSQWIREEQGGGVTTAVLITVDGDKQSQFNDAMHAGQLQGKVVRDTLAVKLLLRRNQPDALWVDMDRENIQQLLGQLESLKAQLNGVTTVFVSREPQRWAAQIAGVREWPAADGDWTSLTQPVALMS